MSAVQQQLEASTALMTPENGFDVVIICTNTEKMAQYWTARLEAGRGTVIPASTTVLSVAEDWPGGAGNAFGTLYAWQKACAASAAKGVDLVKALNANEVSCAIFHTAGKGTRLAPLPGSENNNKPGVKLPATYGTGAPISILEGVVQQVGIYAASRKGRLSVFWGDQVFVPSAAPAYTPQHHADILCTLGPMPDADTWTAKGLEKYGLIAVGASGESAQVEKVSHASATRLLESLEGGVTSVGASLGSFSVTSFLLGALMAEFASELAAKEGKLDTDPGLWMAMTLTLEAYVELMAQKGEDAATSTKHHARMQACKAKLMAPGDGSSSGGGGLKFFGAVDVGADAYWWDYGQLKLYMSNNLKLLLPDDNHEAATMRSYFKMDASRVSPNSSVADAVAVSGGSCISSTVALTGSIEGALLAGVRTNHVEAGHGSVLVNVTAKSIKVAPGCLVYNVATEEDLVVDTPGSVLTTAVLPSTTASDGAAASEGGEKLTAVSMKSQVDLDGGNAWKQVVLENPYSFEQVYNANTDADVAAMEQHAMGLHAAAAAKL